MSTKIEIDYETYENLKILNKRKEHITDYNREYYKKNKEVLLANAKRRVKCDICGQEYMKSNKTKHSVSRYHIGYRDATNNK